MDPDDAESGTRPTRPPRLLLIIVLVLVLTLGLAAALGISRLRSGPNSTPARQSASPVSGSSAATTPAAEPEGSGEHTAYIDEVLGLMDQGYFAEGAQWASAKATAHAEAGKAATMTQAHEILDRALAVAGGHHSRLFRPGEGLDTGVPERLPTVTDDGCVSTLVVPALGSKDADFNRRYAVTLADAINSRRASACGFVVDLRGNTGGNAWPMVAGLAALIPDGPMLDFVHRDGSATQVVITGNRALVGSDEMISVDTGPKVGVPVAVLTDQRTASSAEVVALAFVGLPRARRFGTATAGFSSSNDLFPLSDGATLMLTTGMDRDRTGALRGGVIEPDVPTVPDEALPAAIDWIRATR